jgi:hypothetical protein
VQWQAVRKPPARIQASFECGQAAGAVACTVGKCVTQRAARGWRQAYHVIRWMWWRQAYNVLDVVARL